MNLSKNFFAFLIGVAALIIIPLVQIAMSNSTQTPHDLLGVSLISHVLYITWFGLIIAIAMTIQAWFNQEESKLFSVLNLLLLGAAFAINSLMLMRVMVTA